MLTICVTGGLGSGKSLACEIFYNLGCEIFDADIEAKMILFSNPDVKFGLVDRFGKKILNQGKIDKKTLSKLIFSDIQNQQFLNNLVHPLVIQKFLSQKINVKKSIYIMDAALLFEANIQDHFDKTILIFTGQHLRLKRAIKRGNLSHEQILRQK